jgi:hypothetical protein
MILITGVAWLSSVRAVRRLVYSNQRTKLFYIAVSVSTFSGVRARDIVPAGLKSDFQQEPVLSWQLGSAASLGVLAAWRLCFMVPGHTEFLPDDRARQIAGYSVPVTISPGVLLCNLTRWTHARHRNRACSKTRVTATGPECRNEHTLVHLIHFHTLQILWGWIRFKASSVRSRAARIRF